MAQAPTKLSEAQLRVLRELANPEYELRFYRGYRGPTPLRLHRVEDSLFVRDVHAASVGKLRDTGLAKLVPVCSKYMAYVLTDAGKDAIRKLDNTTR